VTIGGSLSALSKAFKTAKRMTVDQGAKLATSFMRSFGNALRRAATRYTRWAILGISAAFGAITYKSIRLGLELQELDNRFRVAFGSMAKQADKWALKYSRSVRRGTEGVRDAAAAFAVFFKGAGLGEDAVFKMSRSLTKLAYDISSFFALPVAKVTEDFKSGLVALPRALYKYGVVINETATKQWAMQHGILKTGETLTETGKMVARYGLLLEKTTQFHGDLNRTMQSPLNRLRSMRDAFVDIMEIVGRKVTKTKGFGGLAEVLRKFGEYLKGANWDKFARGANKVFKGIMEWIVAPDLKFKELGLKLRNAFAPIEAFFINIGNHIKWFVELVKWAVGKIPQLTGSAVKGAGNLFQQGKRWVIDKASKFMPVQMQAPTAGGGRRKRPAHFFGTHEGPSSDRPWYSRVLRGIIPALEEIDSLFDKARGKRGSAPPAAVRTAPAKKSPSLIDIVSSWGRGGPPGAPKWLSAADVRKGNLAGIRGAIGARMRAVLNTKAPGGGDASFDMLESLGIPRSLLASAKKMKKGGYGAAAGDLGVQDFRSRERVARMAKMGIAPKLSKGDPSTNYLKDIRDTLKARLPSDRKGGALGYT
jgi:hypothetical protein